MYSLETVTSLGGFHALREEWNELLEGSTSNSPFLTWEWLYTWCELLAEDRKLNIIVVRRGDRLEAIAPLAWRPWRLKRLLPFRGLEYLGGGFVGSDYLHFILRRGSERAVMPMLVEELEKSGLMLQLSQMDEEAPLTNLLKDAMTQKGFLVSSELVDVCPCIDLRGHGFDTYLQSLGPSHRGNYRRRIRNLNKDFSVRFERAANERQRLDILSALIDLHLQRWQTRGGSNALADPALQRFHHRFSRMAMHKGWLRLYALRADDRIAATLYCLSYGGTFYYYQLGFDTTLAPYSPGLCALGLCIEDAIAEGATEFDFLRGEEQYKYLWATGKRSLVRLDVYPPYLKGKIARGAMAARQDIVRHGRRMVPQARGVRFLIGR